MASSGKSGVLIDCILVEIKETKLTTFDLRKMMHYKTIYFNFLK